LAGCLSTNASEDILIYIETIHFEKEQIIIIK